MIILGAKGFAKEVLEVLHQACDIEKVVFFDDINNDIKGDLYGKFAIIKSELEAQKHFLEVDNRFTIGIGNPVLRQELASKFIKLGGQLTSTISPKADIGAFGNRIGEGCNIMTGTVITNDVIIGVGTLINLNSTIGHDTIIGNFVEVSPGVSISGNCVIGDYCNIGTGAVILPKVKLGKNVIVGAGAVVTKDVEDNMLVVGVPAKPIKVLEQLKFN